MGLIGSDKVSLHLQNLDNLWFQHCKLQLFWPVVEYIGCVESAYQVISSEISSSCQRAMITWVLRFVKTYYLKFKLNWHTLHVVRMFCMEYNNAV